MTAPVQGAFPRWGRNLPGHFELQPDLSEMTGIF